MALIQATHAYNIIYVYSAEDNDADHQGIVKIGKATVHVAPQKFEQLTPNCPALVKAANDRIHEQTGTYGAAHQLLYTELAHIKNEEGEELQFYDTDVHQVLLNSGYTRHFFPKLDKQPQEWFDIAPKDIHIVEEAIAAVKEGRSTIEGQPTLRNRLKSSSVMNSWKPSNLPYRILQFPAKCFGMPKCVLAKRSVHSKRFVALVFRKRLFSRTALL